LIRNHLVHPAAEARKFFRAKDSIVALPVGKIGILKCASEHLAVNLQPICVPPCLSRKCRRLGTTISPRLRASAAGATLS
jgi:hypothetical protein